MKYKITASTNPYIASRDIHFNGKTSYTVIDGLTKKEAIEKLNDFLLDDYASDGCQLVETEEEFVKEYCGALIYRECEMDADEYFKLTFKRWTKYVELTHNKMFGGWRGAGFYRNNGEEPVLEKLKDGESYEYDSRYYTIEEETKK